ncbi:hypothetical protein RUND412_005251 [Rhizina undulata]
MTEMATPTLGVVKRQLRSLVRKKISSIPADSIAAQSQICVQTLLSLPEYASARRVSVFLSMPEKEINTSSIVEDALQTGKTLYIPYIHRRPPTRPAPESATTASSLPSSLMDMLSLASLDDYRSLEPDAWGIPSISDDSVSKRSNCLDESEDNGLDLIVMPGVAFDYGFSRLGHGKGYYDYFLARYKQVMQQKEGEGEVKMPLLVALAFKEQVLKDGAVPVNSSDWPMDMIVTGEGKLLRKQH